MIAKRKTIKFKGTMLMWQIWWDRNQIHLNPSRTIIRAHLAHEEWLHAQHNSMFASNGQLSQPSSKDWHDLAYGQFLCNVDATFFLEMNAMENGIIVKNAIGDFVAARRYSFPIILE